jgi:chromate transporter
MNPLLYFGLMLKASLFSVSGWGNFPAVHADFMARGWATERQFAESLMVGQIAPGPNGLWVVSLGYLTDGPSGAGLTLLAILLPPLLVLVVERFYESVQDRPAVRGFLRGLTLAVVGMIAVVMAGLLGVGGVNWPAILIAVIAAGLSRVRRIPVAIIIGGAGLIGVLLLPRHPANRARPVVQAHSPGMVRRAGSPIRRVPPGSPGQVR